MGWQIWTIGGSLWSCGLLTMASHQVRTGVKRMVELRQWETAELAWQTMVEVVNETEVRGMVSLARQSSNEGADKVTLPEKHPAETISPNQEMGQALAQLVAEQPMGTNLGLMLFLWMLVSGQLLNSRGDAALAHGCGRTQPATA